MTKRSRLYFSRKNKPPSNGRIYPLPAIHTDRFGSRPIGVFLIDEQNNIWGSDVPIPPATVPKREHVPTHYEVRFEFLNPYGEELKPPIQLDEL